MLVVSASVAWKGPYAALACWMGRVPLSAALVRGRQQTERRPNSSKGPSLSI